MSEIPEDIMRAAREVGNAVRVYRHNVSQAEMVRDAAAQAILAERERCAKIIEGSWQSSLASYEICRTLAARIRNPEQKP